MDNTGNTSAGDCTPTRSDIADKGRHIINTNDFGDDSKSIGIDKRVGPAKE